MKTAMLFPRIADGRYILEIDDDDQATPAQPINLWTRHEEKALHLARPIALAHHAELVQGIRS